MHSKQPRAAATQSCCQHLQKPLYSGQYCRSEPMCKRTVVVLFPSCSWVVMFGTGCSSRSNRSSGGGEKEDEGAARIALLMVMSALAQRMVVMVVPEWAKRTVVVVLFAGCSRVVMLGTGTGSGAGSSCCCCCNTPGSAGMPGSCCRSRLVLEGVFESGSDAAVMLEKEKIRRPKTIRRRILRQRIVLRAITVLSIVLEEVHRSSILWPWIEQTRVATTCETKPPVQDPRTHLRHEMTSYSMLCCW